MKTALKIGGGILALLIVALLVAPFFIDLNSYKDMIAAEAKSATGRDLSIEGDISLSLLPLPSVSVEGIKFGNAPNGAAANMAEIERVEVKVALLPLISSNVEIKSIELVNPVIVLEKLPDGSGNWDINTSPDAAATEAAPTEPAAADAAGGPSESASDSAGTRTRARRRTQAPSPSQASVELRNCHCQRGSTSLRLTLRLAAVPPSS